MGNQTKRVNVHDLKLSALELRKQGKTYAQIGKAIGRSKTIAHKWVGEALRETMQEPADELRTLELARLDALSDKLWPMIVKDIPDDVEDDDEVDYRPTLTAIDRYLRVMERRARLLGLDAPAKQEIAGAFTLQLSWGDNDDGNDNSSGAA